MGTESMKTKNIEELLKLDKELYEYCKEMDLVTQYNRYKKKFPYERFSFVRQKALEELEKINVLS